MLPPRRTPATASLLIATAFFAFSTAALQAQGRSGACAAVRTLRSWPRRLRRRRARRCGSSLAPRSRSTANCRWSRPTAALPPNRASGSAGRLISRSPRSMRLPLGNGGRPSLRRTAAMLPAKSPCAPISRRGRKARPEACGRCAMPGIAEWRTCSRPGSRNSLTRRSTPRRHGRRCTRCCATNPATSCSTILVSAKTRSKIVLRPDCADLPYFLRAYFAFKMGLPFGFSKCSRGGGGTRRRVSAGRASRAPRPGRAEICRIVRQLYARCRGRRALRHRAHARER